MTTDAEAAVAAAFAEEWGRVVATLIRITGDWDLAEESTQDAFAEALRRWPEDGVPRRPGAWLTTVARHRAIDQLRRGAIETAKLREIAVLSTPTAVTAVDGDSGIADERLRLLFTCCHPALPFEAQVALTLRTLAGLTTAEIARAFLVSETTMAKRLVRAKHKIANAGIPYRVPPDHLLAKRLAGVLAVLYLLFNEGYSAPTDDEPYRENLCIEAIHLARALLQLMPDEPEAGGLLALMLLQHSRRYARLDGDGDVVTLENQDRTGWDRTEIGEAIDLLENILIQGRVGPYQLQAAIAACHADAVDATATDWAQIVALYRRLAKVMPSSVVDLNLAVAVAMLDGPAAGLKLVEATAPMLEGYFLLHATRADLLRRLKRRSEALQSYRRALQLTDSDTERRFLARRIEEVAGEEPWR